MNLKCLQCDGAVAICQYYVYPDPVEHYVSCLNGDCPAEDILLEEYMRLLNDQ